MACGPQSPGSSHPICKKKRPVGPRAQLYRRGPGASGLSARRKGTSTVMEFPEGLSASSLSAAFEQFMGAYKAAGQKVPKD